MNVVYLCENGNDRGISPVPPQAAGQLYFLIIRKGCNYAQNISA